MRTISPAQFQQDYRPMPNPFNNNADYHGWLLGKENPDYHRVMTFMQETPEQVWTLIEKKDGSRVLSCGFTTVRAIGYVVTQLEPEGVVEVVD